MNGRRLDPNDPDFPHGTPQGERLGCTATFPCPGKPTTCREIQREARKVRDSDKTPKYYLSAPLRRHIQNYLDRGWTSTAIYEAAGVSVDAVRGIKTGRNPIVTAKVAKAVLDVNRDTLLSLDDSATPIPVAECSWMLGALYADGHTVTALAARLGCDIRSARGVIRGTSKRISRDFYADIVTLHDMMASTPGPDTTAANQARRRAAALGFRTPDEYAPDGTLWADDGLDEKTRKRLRERYDRSYARLTALLLSLRGGLSAEQIAEKIAEQVPGTKPDDVRRWREQAGLRFETPVRGEVSILCPGQDAEVAKVMGVLDRWLAIFEADPFPFAFELGFMQLKGWAHLDMPRGITLRKSNRPLAA